jgi:hypothetical protein
VHGAQLLRGQYARGCHLRRFHCQPLTPAAFITYSRSASSPSRRP